MQHSQGEKKRHSVTVLLVSFLPQLVAQLTLCAQACFSSVFLVPRLVSALKIAGSAVLLFFLILE